MSTVCSRYARGSLRVPCAPETTQYQCSTTFLHFLQHALTGRPVLRLVLRPLCILAYTSHFHTRHVSLHLLFFFFTCLSKLNKPQALTAPCSKTSEPLSDTSAQKMHGSFRLLESLQFGPLVVL